MKKFLIGSALIGFLFAGFLSLNATSPIQVSGTMKVAEKAINI
ncbi:hypothetical protein OZL46_11220 [Bacillus sonorensis]|nr:hypothetical protein [Bacillus sonorensis]MCZ0068997.1 hypothetical protein [Bacillus sonorensis]MCZ0096385.1 hypothetical protein [Bacillus sonorensis]MEC1519949.1 hypothetical protein [Bacillus sonorensis]